MSENEEKPANREKLPVKGIIVSYSHAGKWKCYIDIYGRKPIYVNGMYKTAAEAYSSAIIYANTPAKAKYFEFPPGFFKSY